MKDKKYIFIIIIYGLFLTAILVGYNNFYGSTIDWTTQHTAIPEYLRNTFYETKTLVPNLLFNIGAGQNIFNFSYYGLMSPVILISYFLPFISMELYISICSIILYLISGIFMFLFLKKHQCTDKVCLLLSLVFLTLAPLTYHFHYHIMFVWYFPFLFMALFGVDKYLQQEKSFLLMLSILLIILTNYYYAVPSIIVVIIYSVYQVLKKCKNYQEFIITGIKGIIRIIVPILMASFILLPTIYVLLKTNRVTNQSIELVKLFTIQIEESMYYSFSLGISFIFVVAIIGNLSCFKKKEDLFLNLSLLILTFIPFCNYMLNGFLYSRGKVLIPFSILYFVVLEKFLTNLLENKINYRVLYFYSTVALIVIILSNMNSFLTIAVIVDAIALLMIFLCFRKTKNINYLLAYLLIVTLTTAFFNNFNANYITIEEYKLRKAEEKSVIKLLKLIQDDSFYRINVDVFENKNMNKVWSVNGYNSSIYSSSYNSYYHDFYYNKIGNNLSHRNILMTSGSVNPIFHNFIGTKYIISKEKSIVGYEKIEQLDDYYLYYNKNAYPVLYTIDQKNIGSLEKYNTLEFPYNVEYIMKYPLLAKSENYSQYSSTIQEMDLNLEKNYYLDLRKEKSYRYSLPDNLNNKYIIISFNIDNDQSCFLGDRTITIHGIQNKLTCKEWLYKNNNNNFKFILTGQNTMNDLIIKFSPGKYKISNIKVELMDISKPIYNPIQNIKINKMTSTITGNIDLVENGYLITSLPYDEGYKIYIDNKKVNSQLVNTAFLGAKISKGEHTLKIKYQSPFYMQGKIISVIGIIAFFSILFYERTASRYFNNLKLYVKIKKDWRGVKR